LQLLAPTSTNLLISLPPVGTNVGIVAANAAWWATAAQFASSTLSGIIKGDGSGAGNKLGFTFDIILDRATGAGTLDLQFKRITGGETYTILAGSYIQATKLGP
jgi:hypothetical protein